MARLKGDQEPDSELDKDLKINRYGAIGGTAAMLAEEGQASLRALKAIEKINGSKAALRAAGHLLPTYATYLAYAGALLGGAPAVGRYMARNAYKRQEAKNKKKYKK